MHHRASDFGSTCVNGHVGYGSFGFKHKTVGPAPATGAVVDAGTDSSCAFAWVDVAEHDHDARVVSRIVVAFFVMNASLAEFTVFVPGVLR